MRTAVVGRGLLLQTITVVFVLASSSLVVNASEKATASQTCGPSNLPCMPLKETLQRGLDLVKGTLENGTTVLTYDIFDFSYNDDQKYSIGMPGHKCPTWAIPDQLSAQTDTGSKSTTNVGIFLHFSDYLKMKSSAFEIGVGASLGCTFNQSACLALNAGYNRESHSFHSELKGSSHVGSYSLAEWKYFDILTNQPGFAAKLSPGFNAIIENLPEKIKSPQDQKKYNQLVRYYGTSYVTGATMGAYSHLGSFVSQDFMKKEGRSWTAHQWELQFHYLFFNLSTGGFENKSSIHIDEKFQKESKTYQFVRGGDPTLFNKDQQAWLDTTYQFPSWVTLRVTDLSDAFPLSMSKQANNFVATAKHYLTHGSLPGEDEFGRMKDVDSELLLEPYQEQVYPRPLEYYREHYPNWVQYVKRNSPST